MSGESTDGRNLEGLRGARISVAAAPTWVERSKVRNSARQDGAPVTCLLSERRIHVPESGSYSRLVRRLETSQAVQRLSRVEFPFDPGTQRLVIHAVAIFRDGSLTNHARIEDFELMRREAGMEAGIINGQISAVLLLKDVRTGDILDIEYTITDDGGLFPGKSGLIEAIGGAQPVGDWKVSWVDVADRTPAVGGAAEQLRFSKRLDGDRVIREWTGTDLRGEEPEPGMPRDVLSSGFLQVSSFAGWSEVVDPLLEKWSFEPDDRTDLNIEIAAIRYRAGDDETRLLEEAVAVARGAVRYQNYSPGILAMVPANLTTIWERRYGDCKEKTLLLVWLLRELGIAAEPVLVNTGLGPGIRSFLACPAVFDHVVTRVRLGARELWIDPTDLYRGGSPAGWNSLPFGAGLPLAAGSRQLVVIPPDFTGATFLHVNETLRLDSKSRDARIAVEFQFSGARADGVRALLDSEGRSGLQKALKSLMESTRRGIAIESELTIGDDLARNRITVDLQARLPDALQRDAANQCEFIGLAPFAFSGLIPCPDGVARKQPLALEFPERVEHEVRVDHPLVNKADYPRQSSRHEAFQFDCGSRMDRRMPVFWFKYETLADRVRPAAVAGFKQAVEKAYKALDLALTLPISSRVRFSANDPGRRWNG